MGGFFGAACKGDEIPVFFAVDDVGAFFAVIVSIAWLAVGIYATVYMKHEGKEKRFFGYYLCVRALRGVNCSLNVMASPMRRKWRWPVQRSVWCWAA